jgi:hypothetical protein
MNTARFLLVLASLTLLAPSAASAAGVYQIQPIVHLGDKLGPLPIRTRQGFWVGSLNDSGQIVFVTVNFDGGPLLIRYASGQFTLIVDAGQPAPVGTWPELSEVWSPVSMNQAGNVVFSVLDHQTSAPLGTFLWDPHSGHVGAIAAKGAPSGNNQTLFDVGGPSPVINNHNEIAFVAHVKNVAGAVQSGVFFLGSDGRMQPIAVPDQVLPDGGRVLNASYASANDSGLVACLITRAGDSGASAYLSEAGILTPLALAGTAAPGGGTIENVEGAWVNNKNHNVLVEASVKATSKATSAASSLYRWADGSLTPVALAGKALPDGETLKTVTGGVSAANDLGQHVFLATLASKATAAYLMNADGSLSLVLKSSPTAEPGAIKRVGEASTFGVALNNHGQIALVVLFVNAHSSTLVLMTPQ